MRALRTLFVLLTAGIVGAATVAIASPSAAGGPTSVMLINAATGQGAALHTSDERYHLLAEIIGAFDQAPVDAVQAPPGLDPVTATPNIRATWLIHDVTAWRLDHIYLDAPDGPWVSSRTDSSGTGSVWDAEPVWHRPARAEELAKLIGQLGLSSPLGLGSPAASLSPGTTAATVPPSSSEPTGSVAAELLWGLVGMVSGAGMAIGLGRMRRGRRTTHDDTPGDIEADLDEPIAARSST
jgi:hypothetical protein